MGKFHTSAVIRSAMRLSLKGDDDLQSGSVGRNSTSQGRTKPGEECLHTTAGVDRADRTADGRTARSTLHARLDGVDGEDGDPHGDTSSTTSRQDGGHRELPGDVAVLILGGEGALDVLVGGEVGGRSGTIPSERHGATPEDTADSTLLVQLADDIHSTGVLGLLAGWGWVLTLDLEQHLDTLERRRDQGHGDGGEETGSRDLANCVLRGVVLNPHSGEAAHERLTQVITLVKRLRPDRDIVRHIMNTYPETNSD